MSVSHHSSSEEENRKRLLDQFLNRAAPAFPGGHLNSDDQGELAFAVAVDLRRNIVVIRFGKPIDWIGLRKPEVIALAKMLQEKADQLP